MVALTDDNVALLLACYGDALRREVTGMEWLVVRKDFVRGEICGVHVKDLHADVRSDDGDGYHGNFFFVLDVLVSPSP